MNARMAALAAASLVGLACLAGPGGMARADISQEIPQSDRAEHISQLGYLRTLAARPTPVGKAAQKVLDVLQPHMAREELYILPPLMLLPDLAAGKVTPDMRWAVAMAELVKAEQAALLHSHEDLSNALIELLDAAQEAGDEATIGFTKDMAGDDLSDREITEPTTILIGKFLRGRLPAAQ